MAIAALIISALSLIASLGCLVIMLAKNYFSTHVVQLQPVDTAFQAASPGKPVEDSFVEFDAKPLDPDEEDYFKRQNIK
mgnify:CR=1 FL=1